MKHINFDNWYIIRQLRGSIKVCQWKPTQVVSKVDLHGHIFRFLQLLYKQDSVLLEVFFTLNVVAFADTVEPYIITYSYN